MTPQSLGVFSEWYEFCAQLLQVSREKTTAGESILKWIDIVLKVANLGIIVWIFKKNFAERKSERIRDTRRETADFLIRDVILEPNLVALDALFKDRSAEVANYFAEVLANSSQSATDGRARLKVVIDQVKRPIHQLRERIVSPLIDLSSHFQPLEPVFEALEDICTEALEYAFRNGGRTNVADEESAYADKIVETHRKFTKALLNGYQDFLKLEESSGVSENKKTIRNRCGNAISWFGDKVAGNKASKA